MWEGRTSSVHSEQMSLNLELLQPVADTLGSSERPGGWARERLREADGWSHDEPPGVTRCVSGWRRLEDD